METNKIAVLILAAGAAKRMGEIKQLLQWGNTTLLGNAIKNALEISNPVYVVLGANAEIIKKELPSEVTIVPNKDWENGMGSSIAKGIIKIEETGQYEAVLIQLADQPLLDSNHLKKIIDQYMQHNTQMVATKYNRHNGVPALFHNSFFHELKTLNKDIGAKELLNGNANSVSTVIPKFGSEVDIDTPETYKFLKKKYLQPRTIKK